MAFCTNCGRQLREEKFCPECGSPAPYAPAAPGTQIRMPGGPTYPAVPPPKSGMAGGIRGRPETGLSAALGIAGAAMMFIAIVGSVLPWAKASSELFSVSVGGLKGDGVITLVAAVFGILAFGSGILLRTRWPFISALALSLVVLGVAIYDTVDIATGLTVGAGLLLCLIAGILAVLVAVAGIFTARMYP